MEHGRVIYSRNNFAISPFCNFYSFTWTITRALFSAETKMIILNWPIYFSAATTPGTRLHFCPYSGGLFFSASFYFKTTLSATEVHKSGFITNFANFQRNCSLIIYAFENFRLTTFRKWYMCVCRAWRSLVDSSLIVSVEISANL